MRAPFSIVAAVWGLGCQPDSALQLPPADQLCPALDAGELDSVQAEPGEQADVHLTAQGERWGDAGYWGAVPCGEVFAAKSVSWTAEVSGTWSLVGEVADAESARAQGVRTPIVMVWSTEDVCDCAVSERGVLDVPVDLEAGEAVDVLVGLESTASRREGQVGGFEVPYRVRLIPEVPR